MNPMIGYQLGNNFALETPIDAHLITYIKEQYGAYLSHNKKLWILPDTDYQRILNDEYLKRVVTQKYIPSNKLVNRSEEYASKTDNKGLIQSEEYRYQQYPFRTDNKGLIQKDDSREYYSHFRTNNEGLIQKDDSREYYYSRTRSHMQPSQKNNQTYYSQTPPYRKNATQSKHATQQKQWRMVQRDSLGEISIFPTGLVELDRQIILEARISDLINMYDVSRYFRDLLDHPYTFLLFKNKYPFTVMTSFQDFLTLNDELKTTVPRHITPDFQFGPEIYLPGDRLFTGLFQINKNNYKVIKVVPKDKLYLYKVNMLGVPTENIVVEAKGEYPSVEENDRHQLLLRGIIKHELGPEVTSIDSPFLLYKTNPLNPSFYRLRSKYPTEENYKANLHIGLVSTVEYKDTNGTVRLPYVIDDLYDDDVILKYIGTGEYGGVFNSGVHPLVLHITYIHESHTWYSPEYGTIILTPGDWREGYVNLRSVHG
jgi:hypothetical protein